jgi:hypothetical protein
MRFPFVVSIFVVSTACQSGTGVHQAEVIATPFPGTVLAAHATSGKCLPEACPFVYRVRITNPTDRDANVQTCTLTEPPGMRLPVMGIGGVGMGAFATKTVSASFVLPIERSAAKGLVGQRASCTGLDWHGDPPI